MINTAALSLVSGVFLLLTTIALWRSVVTSQRVIRVALVCLLLFSSIVRSWVYRPGLQPAPVWFSPILDIIMTTVAISSTWVAWDQKRGKIER